MVRFFIQETASHRIDEIYRYALKRWGYIQAEDHINGLFTAFEKIESHEVFSRQVPAEFKVDGFFFRYQKHFVYWRYLSTGDVGIVTIMHERMHQIEQFKDDFGL